MNEREIVESKLPGGDLIARGLHDLRRQLITEEALLVLIASPRLSRLGIEIPSSSVAEPFEHALYTLLEELYGDEAYSRYNSLIRRVVSFSRALEREVLGTNRGTQTG